MSTRFGRGAQEPSEVAGKVELPPRPRCRHVQNVQLSIALSREKFAEPAPRMLRGFTVVKRASIEQQPAKVIDIADDVQAVPPLGSDEVIVAIQHY